MVIPCGNRTFCLRHNFSSAATCSLLHQPSLVAAINFNLKFNLQSTWKISLCIRLKFMVPNNFQFSVSVTAAARSNILYQRHNLNSHEGKATPVRMCRKVVSESDILSASQRILLWDASGVLSLNTSKTTPENLIF